MQVSSGADAWRPLVAAELSAGAIGALVAGEVPYVHVPAFLQPDWCAEVVRRFTAAVAALPDHQELSMGPMIFDTLAMPVELFVDAPDPDAYFARVVDDAPRVRALFAGGEDPLDKMRAAWAQAGWSDIPASEGPGRSYHPDVVWGIREAAAPPHVDSYERDRVIALSRFPRRFNYNVYLQTPDSGGDFIVYDRRSSTTRAGEQAWRDPDAIGAQLGGVARACHRPCAGDLVLFDATLYHEVTRVDGHRRRRVQVHSGIVADPGTRELAFFI